MYVNNSIIIYIYLTAAIFMGIFIYTIPQVQATTENLISNPDFELTSNTGLPQNWTKGRWGTNSTLLEYPVLGINNSKAARINITQYTSGDAKWKFSEVPVTPGKEYQFSDFYLSDISSYVTIQFKKIDGTFSYKDIGHPGPSTDFQKITFTFVAPPNTQSLSIFHLINQVGTLTVDQFELTDITPLPPPAPDENNLIVNPSFEFTNGLGTLPQNWTKGRWGVNAAEFTFGVNGYASEKAARVQINTHTNGDAKWYFDEVPTTPGTVYEFSDFWKSNTKTYVAVRFKLSNGTFTFLDLGTTEASPDWQPFKKTFTVPLGAVSLTVFHLIKNVGTLDVDAYTLKKLASDPNKFTTGMVSINFDDGWRSAHENAIPMLDAAGFKSTQFIITGRMDPKYPGYIRASEVLSMQSQGHEIGAHTRTHPDLSTLTKEQMQNEIAGSKTDLQSIGVNTVDLFAYPFGSYNDQVKSIVQEAGFIAGRSSDGGYNLKTQDPFDLRRQPMTANTTLTDIQNYIDTAINDKTWVILLFHEVNNSGNQYSVTPELFQKIVDYLKLKNITPVTLHQAIALQN